MARELDNILDQFLTKGYEECTREFNAIELHREHGVCIKIKKNIMDYSVFIKVHKVKLIGSVARHIVKIVIDELGSDVIANSSYSHSYVEIRVPNHNLTYRKLEQVVDIFYMRFTSDYLGLIQSQQMGVYREETIENSYDALRDTNVSSGEYRDESHSARVHGEDSTSKNVWYQKDYRNADDYVKPSSKSVGLKVFIGVSIFIIIVALIISCSMNTYDIYGYIIDKYSSETYEITEITNNEYYYAYQEAHIFEYSYEQGAMSSEVFYDVNQYVNYLVEDWDFRVYSGNTFIVEGEEYFTNYMAYKEDCYIYFGSSVDTSSTGSYIVTITFICEYFD